MLRHGDFGQAFFHLAAGEDLETVRIEAVQEVLVCAVGIGIGEKVIVNADLGFAAVVGVHPVDGGALDLTAVGRIAAAAVWVVLSEDLGDFAVLILYAARACHEIGTF